ncbi:MAG: hypothetical protein WAV73_02005 [Candidatus Moraniibacteriota bacterium]
MANINLVTDRENTKMLGTGTTVLLVIFFVVLLIYGGMIFYGNKLGTDLATAKEEYAAKFNMFTIGDSKKVLDFQNRLTISNELLAMERDNGRDLENIESVMIDGVYLESYTYDEAAKIIKIDCFADSYDTVAKQILSFKGDDYFSTVLAGETKLDAKRRMINFPVVLTIK